MNLTSPPEGYAYSKVSMSTFLNTPQSKKSVNGYFVVNKNQYSYKDGWKDAVVYPIQFWFDPTDKSSEKLIQMGYYDDPVKKDKVYIYPTDLKKDYYLLMKGQVKLTNGGKSRRRRQNKRKGKKRTRRYRK